MKRKSLKVLALAVPLVGLALVWRAGQRTREEADICEAVVRSSMAAYAGQAPEFFVSMNGQDPPVPFVQRFGGSVPAVLAGSHRTPDPRSILKSQIAMTIIRAHRALLFNIQSVRWADGDNASVQVEVTHSSQRDTVHHLLKRQGGQWKVVRREVTF